MVVCITLMVCVISTVMYVMFKRANLIAVPFTPETLDLGSSKKRGKKTDSKKPKRVRRHHHNQQQQQLSSESSSAMDADNDKTPTSDEAPDDDEAAQLGIADADLSSNSLQSSESDSHKSLNERKNTHTNGVEKPCGTASAPDCASPKSNELGDFIVLSDSDKPAVQLAEPKNSGMDSDSNSGSRSSCLAESEATSSTDIRDKHHPISTKSKRSRRRANKGSAVSAAAPLNLREDSRSYTSTAGVNRSPEKENHALVDLHSKVKRLEEQLQVSFPTFSLALLRQWE